MALFMAGAVLCGMSRSIGALIGWRVVQGLGAALVSANSVAYLVEIYPPNRRGFVVGTFIAPNDSAILSAAARGKLGVANGVMGVARTLGLLLGVSAAGGLLSARLVANGDAFLPSFHQVYWVVAAVTFAGIWLGAIRDRRSGGGEAK